MTWDDAIVPSPLKAGDKIAIVSPSGAVKPEFIDNAVAVLRAQGWNPYVSTHARGRVGSYSGSEDERFADLAEAILDKDVKAVMCSRGGYGAVHLLQRMDGLALRENAKWLIGFSDISALHALMAKHGVASVHGPMCKHISKIEDAEALFKVLRGEGVEYHLEADELNRCGVAEGMLVGGNLAVLSGLAGSPFDVFQPGRVLFIEDVSEPIYAVERMLYRMKLSGVLGGIEGLIVGDFTRYEPDYNYASMQRMISDMVMEYDYPVAFGMPVGHGEHSLPLIESGKVRLEVTPQGTIIKQ